MLLDFELHLFFSSRYTFLNPQKVFYSIPKFFENPSDAFFNAFKHIKIKNNKKLFWNMLYSEQTYQVYKYTYKSN